MVRWSLYQCRARADEGAGRKAGQFSMEIFYIYRGSDLNQIAWTSGSLNSAKIIVERSVTVERYDDDDQNIYAVADGERVYRIERRVLK